MTPNAQRGDHDADSRRISGQQMSEMIPCRLDPYGRSPDQDLGQVNPFCSPGTQRRAQARDQDALDVVGRQGWVRDRVDEIEGLRRRVLQEAEESFARQAKALQMESQVNDAGSFQTASTGDARHEGGSQAGLVAGRWWYPS